MEGKYNPSYSAEDEKGNSESKPSITVDVNSDALNGISDPRRNPINSVFDNALEETVANGNEREASGARGLLGHFGEFSQCLCFTYSKYKHALHIFAVFTVHIAIFAYSASASIYWKIHKGPQIEWCDGIGLLWILLAVFYGNLIFSWNKLSYIIGGFFIYVIEPMWERAWENVIFHWFVYLTPPTAFIVFLVIDAGHDMDRYISFLGIVVIILLGFIFSRHPKRVNWHTVFWGLILQYIFGLLAIRWHVGRRVMECVGDKISKFLAFSNTGATMVYGNFLIDEKYIFAFRVLSSIFFFSFCIKILYYYGIMQKIIFNLGSILQCIMGTTACESVNTAGNIFVGMVESPIMIQPYIGLLTKSEIHSVMTSGLATIAGGVMAAYISFGVSPAHLLAASIMSAPAALCFSKLFYPETEQTATEARKIVFEKRTETNVLDAATSGAMSAVALIHGIIANLIAFVSFVAFLNALMAWLGSLLGAEYLSFEWILSKVFIPMAWLLGVAPHECEDVATLMGLKTVVNEFIAYKHLVELVKAEKLSKRAETIATYALCGFSNPASLGILVGGLSTISPEKRSDITEVAFRSFISGCATCFLTACVAGTLVGNEVT